MKTRFFFLLAAFPLWGEITVSPASISLTMRGWVADYPRQATICPRKTTITVSGTGDWKAVTGGALGTNACAPWGEPCFEVSPASGSGPATVTVSWLNRNLFRLTPGEYTGTVTIAGNVTVITLTVAEPKPWAVFTYPEGYPQGC